MIRFTKKIYFLIKSSDILFFIKILTLSYSLLTQTVQSGNKLSEFEYYQSFGNVSHFEQIIRKTEITPEIYRRVPEFCIRLITCMEREVGYVAAT